ncbi:hypothetical protein CORC01_12724 [Colletotrichum orchidophilum]|uniref:Secreted protein n=1 Tax=Colletotrichum orchidophilum TaxID=1209926 RepID=A0A1G4AS49_9PEZI|nr:uncharacterized protein CORC01_12724 [Colletotrichum orchidophilum]OHE91988.1 hypothetical protein CORC01_12724 [Colletotrichum orchidophilum]
MTALHLAPLFLSYLHSDAITACCYSSLRPPRCLLLKWRPCYAAQAFPPLAGSINEDVCLNCGFWGLADMRLGRSGSDLRQEERHERDETERQSQNGNMTILPSSSTAAT